MASGSPSDARAATASFSVSVVTTAAVERTDALASVPPDDLQPVEPFAELAELGAQFFGSDAVFARDIGDLVEPHFNAIALARVHLRVGHGEFVNARPSVDMAEA